MSRSTVIVDFNKIFSALLYSQTSTGGILKSEEVRFFAPNYLMNELFHRKEKILKFSKLDASEFDEILERCLECLRFYPLSEISEANLTKARELTCDVDLKDLPYVALTLELDGLLWTGDKKLQAALRAKGFHQFFEP